MITVPVLLTIIIASQNSLLLVNCNLNSGSGGGISKHILENWASKFGGPLFEFGRSVTKYNELQGRFQTYSNSTKVEKIHLDRLIKEMTEDISTSLRERVDAVRKILLFAEQKALEALSSPNGIKLPDSYLNAKKLNQGKYDPHELYHVVDLHFHHHFGSEVNTSFSSIHVPTSIYERKKALLEAISWTSQMDTVFESNYQTNPTLGFQYFGSAEGFLRQYPAEKWGNVNAVRSNPDLYDCRTRQWYVSAAASPKNMLILQDISGSMTGLRREIAKHVVSTLLDTLTENDYVNVYNFADETGPLVECWRGKLVQANLENIHTLKDSLERNGTSGVANFTGALHTAFDILQAHNGKSASESANCNQALMIITDGSPYNYEEIFRQRQNREDFVRVFTYLIGRDVTDRREVMFMACANNGYYTHVSTLSEVQEEVLKYVPVLSRPLVLHNNHTISWSGVYADVTSTAETYFHWDAWYNAKRQYERASRYKVYIRKNFDNLSIIDEDVMAQDLEDYLDKPSPPLPITARELVEKIGRIFPKNPAPKPHFNFVVSVSTPVFDMRNASKDGARLATLLGVAGTDIPIKHLLKSVSPFKLGVSGYAFITNNNGYVVSHPDWRPIFRGEMLKPNYNAVDLLEVELYDADDRDQNIVRNNHSNIVEMRTEILELHHGYRTLPVRQHMDNFRRVSLKRQKYEYAKIRNTPYTLTLAVPENLHQFQAQMELNLQKSVHEKLDYSSFFKGNWSINPDWSYCDYLRGGAEFQRKEDLFLHFLKRIEQAKKGWKWKNTGIGIKPRHSNKAKVLDGDIYECDRDLVQSLMFDADVTSVFTKDNLYKFNKDEHDFIKLNGATMVFLSTRSGLTRWISLDKNTTPTVDPTSTESIWYKRAVERYLMDPDSFVYSVDFDAGQQDNPVVTATRAVFVNKEGLQAPVAVVGVTYRHKDWAGKFWEITSTCLEAPSQKGGAFTLLSNYVTDSSCQKTCNSAEYDCYVLDDNGFVMISEKQEETGKFFGEIDGMVMEMLVNSDVYRKVRIVDAQAVCFQPVGKNVNAGARLGRGQWLWPWKLLLSFLGSFWNLLVSMPLLPLPLASVSEGYSQHDMNMDIVDATTDSDTLHPFIELASINKTRLRPCDKEVFLYTYGGIYNTYNFSFHGLLTKCGHASGCDGYFNVHYIPNTNLILLVTDGKCHCGSLNNTNIQSNEVLYEVDEAGCSVGQKSREGGFRVPPNDGACVKYNANEQDMDCGGASILSLDARVAAIVSILLASIFYR